jgi:hypothetical protein
MLFKTVLNFKQFKPINNLKLLNNHKKHETNNQPDFRAKSRITHQVFGVHARNGLPQTRRKF